MNHTIRVSNSDCPGVYEVRLNRPDKHNALDDALFSALATLGRELAAQTKLRAVVLTGEGKSFCAGLDKANLNAMGAGRDADLGGDGLTARTHGDANRYQQAALVWRELPVPVIAAVHGVAFGGGLQLALGADLRLATPDSRWSVMEIQWGLVPDMGGTVLLSELVRADRLRELCYSGRVIDGREAAELGLVTQVCQAPLEAALALAGEIATRSPDAIRAVKRLLNQSATPPGQVASMLLAESCEQAALIGSGNQAEAVRARLEGRQPVFRDAQSDP